jgi:hypothetical protein
MSVALGWCLPRMVMQETSGMRHDTRHNVTAIIKIVSLFLHECWVTFCHNVSLLQLWYPLAFLIEKFFVLSIRHGCDSIFSNLLSFKSCFVYSSFCLVLFGQDFLPSG